MNFVYCRGSIAFNIENEIANMSNNDLELRVIKSRNELNLGLLEQKSKKVNLIIIASFIYDDFKGDYEQIMTYLAVLKSFGKFRLVYITDKGKTDVVAKKLVKDGAKDIYQQPLPDKLNVEFLLQCVNSNRTSSLLTEIIELKDSDLLGVIKTYTHLVNSVYSSIDRPSLKSVLTQNKQKFVDIQFNLTGVSNKLDDIKDALLLKDTQLEFYVNRTTELETKQQSAEQMQKRLSTDLKTKLQEVAKLTFMNKDIQEKQKTIIESLNNRTDSVYFYLTKDVDLMNTSAKTVIVFKEYTYCRYFNTFIKYLHRYLTSSTKYESDGIQTERGALKVRIIIFSKYLDTTDIHKFGVNFGGDFVTCDKTDYIGKLQGKDYLITTETRADFLSYSIEDGDYDIVLVIDRHKDFDKDLYKGLKVCKFNVVASRYDSSVFNLDNAGLISSGYKDACIKLPYILAFDSPKKAERVELKRYRETAITDFLNQYKYLYNNNLDDMHNF